VIGDQVEVEIAVDPDPDRLRRLLDLIGFDELIAPATAGEGIG